MSCNYQYDIQPGPTTEICPLEGHSERALILKCQVSSNRSSNFSITWHHSRLVPESNSIADPETIINNSSTTVINNIMVSIQNSSLVSQLTLHGFDDKGAGYYWCSVNLSRDAQTNNPSMILHIVHNMHCKANNEQHCSGDVSLYTNSSSRCADQETSIETLEAQSCPSTTTQTEQKLTDISNPDPDLPIQTSSQRGTAPATITLHITNTQPTPQEDTFNLAPKFHLNMGVIIGASMGGLVLILSIVIGLLLMCVVRMKRKHQTRQHRLDDSTSPFDNIRMYSSIAKLTQEKVDNADRVSKIYCESNTAYECSPHTLASSQTENIYEFIS